MLLIIYMLFHYRPISLPSGRGTHIYNMSLWTVDWRSGIETLQELSRCKICGSGELYRVYESSPALRVVLKSSCPWLSSGQPGRLRHPLVGTDYMQGAFVPVNAHVMPQVIGYVQNMP